jgi:hypothetical protein
MLSGTPSVFPAITFTPPVAGLGATATALVAKDPALGGGIQRFTWVFQVTFTNSAAFPTAVGGDVAITLSASMSRIAAPVVTATGSAVLHLIHEPNPYELDGATSWLSTDFGSSSCLLAALVSAQAWADRRSMLRASFSRSSRT